MLKFICTIFLQKGFEMTLHLCVLPVLKVQESWQNLGTLKKLSIILFIYYNQIYLEIKANRPSLPRIVFSM